MMSWSRNLSVSCLRGETDVETRVKNIAVVTGYLVSAKGSEHNLSEELTFRKDWRLEIV